MIGVVPAAGQALRFNGISKTILPIPGGTLIETMIRRMQMYARLRTVIVGASEQNYQEIIHLRRVNGGSYQVNLVYTDTMNETVLKAKSEHVEDENTIMGMPDTWWEDKSAFLKIIAALGSGAQLAVGVFKTVPAQRSKLGMLRFDETTMDIVDAVDKPEKTDFEWGWGLMGWTPEFWPLIKASEPHTGYSIPRAIEAGLVVKAVPLQGRFFNLGTPEEYFDLIYQMKEGTICEY